MAKIKAYKQARENTKRALLILAVEFAKPRAERVKLTHFWLAEKLGVERIVAFILLEKMAGRREFCVQMPAGPIFWLDDQITLTQMTKLLVPRGTFPAPVTPSSVTVETLKRLGAT